MPRQTAIVSVSDLDEFCRTVLRKCGLSEADARVTADVLVTTDTFGVFTHGIKSLKGYVRRLQAGGLKANAVPTNSCGRPGLGHRRWPIGHRHGYLRVRDEHCHREGPDGGHGLRRCPQQLPFRAAGYYANMAAKADMIGMAMANDIPSMVAPGSRKAVLGTNPFAYAVPAGEQDPIFLDIASSAVAGGKIYIAQALGQKVPDNWLVDAEGVPTTDPFQYPHASALLPFAGHKGYGIAMMIETLAGVLSGAGMTWGIGNWMTSDPSQPTHHGAAFLAINVGAMMPIDVFKRRVDQLIAEVHEAPTAKGASRIYVPGEIEWQKRRKALAEGIALPEDVLASHESLVKQLGMSVDWLRA